VGNRLAVAGGVTAGEVWSSEVSFDSLRMKKAFEYRCCLGFVPAPSWAQQNHNDELNG